MLTALVLICSIAVTPDLGACNGGNAVNVIRLPSTFASPVTCLMHGQAYIAETSIGQDLAENERVKVVCASSQQVESLAFRSTHQ